MTLFRRQNSVSAPREDLPVAGNDHPAPDASLMSRSELVLGWCWLRRQLSRCWPALDPTDRRREDRWAVPAVIALALLLFAPLVERALARGPDLGPHTVFALHMQRLHHPVAPHFLFHWLDYQLAELLKLLGVPAYVHVALYPLDRTEMAGVLIGILATVWTCLLFYQLFRAVTLPDGRPLPAWVALLLVIPAELFAPIPLLYFLDPHHHIYLGYMGINTFHSPTTLLAKPLALLLFLNTYRVVASPPDTQRVRTIAGIAVLTILGFLAKPSFALAYLPALLGIAVVRRMRRAPCDWRALGFGLLLPAALMLLWQWYFVYQTPYFNAVTGGTTAANNGIAFAPFRLMGQDPPLLMAVRYLGITLFAVATAVAYFRQALADPQLRVALVTGLVGLTIATCLVESGPRLSHGNFLWTGQFVLVILMAVSLRFVVQQYVTPDPADPPRARRLRRTLVLLAGAAQFAAGLTWYYALLFVTPVWKWW